MTLAQVVYVSQRADALTDDVLQHIIGRSAQRNAAKNITGALLCAGDHIMQLLEGEADAVQALYQTIKADDRHTGVEHLLFKCVDQRMFPEWGMTMIRVDREPVLDRQRLAYLVNSVQEHVDTGRCSVEARMLLHDFRQQLFPDESPSRTIPWPAA